MTGAMQTQLALGVLVQAFVAWLLFRWARYVAAKQGGFYAKLTWLPFAALVLQIAGVAITSAMLVSAFHGVESIDPVHKASVLSEGIAQAMTAGALLLGPAYAAYVTSVVTSIVGTMRAARVV